MPARPRIALADVAIIDAVAGVVPQRLKLRREGRRAGATLAGNYVQHGQTTVSRAGFSTGPVQARARRERASDCRRRCTRGPSASAFWRSLRQAPRMLSKARIDLLQRRDRPARSRESAIVETSQSRLRIRFDKAPSGAPSGSPDCTMSPAFSGGSARSHTARRPQPHRRHRRRSAGPASGQSRPRVHTGTD